MVKRVLLSVLLATLALPLASAESRIDNTQISIPAGTMVHCRTNATITTMLNKEGDAFTFNVTEPVMINGRVAIPIGSAITGRITQVSRPGRISGVGQMHLNAQQIYLTDGRTFPFAATLITAYGPNPVKVVGNEGLVKGPSSRRADAEEIGAGTAGGTLLGLIFAHPIVGATVGLTATTVDRLRRRGKELIIPIGTQLNYQLNRELALNPDAPRTTASNQVPAGGE
jgi:hypothetical protein